MHRQLVAAIEPLTHSFEIVFVNDGCPANSWEAVQEAAAHDTRVKAINLSRNFGQHYAIAAGLHYCSENWWGGWIAICRTGQRKSPSCTARRWKGTTSFTRCATNGRTAGPSVCFRACSRRCTTC